MPREFPPTPAIRPVAHAQLRDELGQPTFRPSSASRSAGPSPSIMTDPYKPSRGRRMSRIYSAGDNDATTCVVESEGSPPPSRSELEVPLLYLNATQSSQSSRARRRDDEIFPYYGAGSVYSSSTSGPSSDEESGQGFRAAVTRRWKHGVRHMQDQMQGHRHGWESRRSSLSVDPAPRKEVKHIFETIRIAARGDFQRSPERKPQGVGRGVTYSPSTKPINGGKAMELSPFMMSTSRRPSLNPNNPFNDVERDPVFLPPSARKKSKLEPERTRPSIALGLPAFAAFIPKRIGSRRKAVPPRLKLSSPSVEVIEEDNRGRQNSLYIKEFNAKGHLTVAEEPRKSSMNRASFGRRGSWRDHPPDIAPVLEEDEVTALPSYRSWREGSGYSHDQTFSEQCRNDMFPRPRPAKRLGILNAAKRPRHLYPSVQLVLMDPPRHTSEESRRFDF